MPFPLLLVKLVLATFVTSVVCSGLLKYLAVVPVRVVDDIRVGVGSDRSLLLLIDHFLDLMLDSSSLAQMDDLEDLVLHSAAIFRSGDGVHLLLLLFRQLVVLLLLILTVHQEVVVLDRGDLLIVAAPGGHPEDWDELGLDLCLDRAW